MRTRLEETKYSLREIKAEKYSLRGNPSPRAKKEMDVLSEIEMELTIDLWELEAEVEVA